MVTHQNYLNLVMSISSVVRNSQIKVYSVLLYGSFCRGEISPGISDIDLLFILPVGVVKREDIDELRYIMRRIENPYNIKIHLRIRGLNDFSQCLTGAFDCGITSFINKLRDGICICGHNLEHIYLESIMRSNIGNIMSNILLRLSKYRYDIRTLINSNIHDTFVEYSHVRSAISNLAELVCYSHGLFFSNRTESLRIASELYSTNLFSYYLNNQLNERLSYSIFIEEADAIAYDCQINLNDEKIKNLKNISLLYRGNLKQDDKQVANHVLMLKSIGIDTLKTPNITNNKLTIELFNI